jgi:hypothetical protein
MALVAPAAPTGFSGFWQYHAPAGQTGPYNFRFYHSSEEYRAAIQLGKRGFRKYKAQMRALNGVAPGATTVDSFGRVTAVQAMADPQSNGGKRTVATVSNATTTTAGMVTAINAKLFDFTSSTMQYPRDLSTNGGGSRVGR